jgi:Ni2+-binding GTPase involved in maturation of urease and hydrogenase
VLVTPSEKLEVSVPPAIRSLVTSNTCFLINKIDLIPNFSGTTFIQIHRGESKMLRESPVWAASLITGEGTTEFVEGLADALKAQ